MPRCVIETEHLRKLTVFAERFKMVPLLALVVCLANDGMVHLFVFRAGQLGAMLLPVKNGFSMRFGPQHLGNLARHPAVDYSCWREELVGGSWFGESLSGTIEDVSRTAGALPSGARVVAGEISPSPHPSGT